MRFLGANIGDCPHTEGLYKAERIARLAGFTTFVCMPNSSLEEIINEIRVFDPDYIGFSYRLSPEIGYAELAKAINQLEFHGQLKKINGKNRKFAFAGLPDTISRIEENASTLKVDIFPIRQVSDPLKQVEIVFNYFDLGESLREDIIESIKDEMFPPKIELLDHLADEVVHNQNYLNIPPLDVPSKLGRSSLTARMEESKYPLLRSHFGIPADSIMPTVEGIKELAEAQVIDEVSIGSSDLSQRFYGQEEMFDVHKNDGGVPYRNIDDLRKLFLASRHGNFPSCKPYAHTTRILSFIDDCIKTGHLTGAHQAIPLFWFNQLDGRGSTPVKDSIQEHISAVKKLAHLNIPVEMNDPNQWSSRWAHDTIITSDYALITAVMLEAGVKDIILQMQFNKPVETSDFGDIAKMKVGATLAQTMRIESGKQANIHHETRTGIEYFGTDMERAKWQLARSTILQLFLNPNMIHIVSYCEAVRIASPKEIIESSKIVRKAIDIFRENEYDLRKYEDHELVKERISFLQNESNFLLSRIARLDEGFKSNVPITKSLCKPDVIYNALAKGIMVAPGIMNQKYKRDDIVTKPSKNGYFNSVEFETSKLLTEQERLSKLF